MTAARDRCQHWTAEPYDLRHRWENGDTWALRYNPTPGGTKNEDGSTSFSLSFPALVLTPWVANKEHEAHVLADAMNRFADLERALRAAEAFVAGFEGDEMQEGVDDLLSTIRAALTKEVRT